jgi:radical SAM protein with 4Fe4S-binding SPASM domain
MVYGILGQAVGMGYRGKICFNFYNEPLLDTRLPAFGRYAKQLGFSPVMFATNGDFLNQAMAISLDACFDYINVSPYDDNSEARKSMTQSWFAKTRIRFTNGLHFGVHCFEGDDEELGTLIDRRCPNPSRNLAVNHRGDFLACCQEMIPHFGLGNVYDSPLEKLWNGKQKLNEVLAHTTGRRNHPYCCTCLRGSAKEYVTVVQNAPDCSGEGNPQ